MADLTDKPLVNEAAAEIERLSREIELGLNVPDVPIPPLDLNPPEPEPRHPAVTRMMPGLGVTSHLQEFAAMGEGEGILGDLLEAEEQIVYGPVIRYGVAKSNWVYVSGPGADYVDIHPCDDKDGSNVDTGTTIRVHLLYNAEGAHPAIWTNQILLYWPIDATTAICIDPTLDARIGDYRWIAHTTTRTGWFNCDGQSLLREDYPVLFAAIGVGWGSADADHFNLPDVQHRSLVHIESSPFLLGASGGEPLHGAGANDHDDHAIDYVEAGLMDTQVLIPPPGHTETDNYHPWAASVLTIRAY